MSTTQGGIVIVHRGEHLVAVNLTSDPRTVRIGAGAVLCAHLDPCDAVVNGGEINLAAESAAVLERVAS